MPAVTNDPSTILRSIRDLMGQLLPARHSKDFRSVYWFGEPYVFTPLQAAIVRQLWEAWELGCPELGAATLLETAGAETDDKRIPSIFKDHPAFQKMIFPGSTKGAYCLREPQL